MWPHDRYLVKPIPPFFPPICPRRIVAATSITEGRNNEILRLSHQNKSPRENERFHFRGHSHQNNKFLLKSSSTSNPPFSKIKYDVLDFPKMSNLVKSIFIIKF